MFLYLYLVPLGMSRECILKIQTDRWMQALQLVSQVLVEFVSTCNPLYLNVINGKFHLTWVETRLLKFTDAAGGWAFVSKGSSCWSPQPLNGFHMIPPEVSLKIFQWIHLKISKVCQHLHLKKPSVSDFWVHKSARQMMVLYYWSLGAWAPLPWLLGCLDVCLFGID